MSLENILLTEECSHLKRKYENDGWTIKSQNTQLVHGGYFIETVCVKDGKEEVFTENFQFLNE